MAEERVRHLFESIAQAEAGVTMALQYLREDNVGDREELREIRRYLQTVMDRLRIQYE